jgi:hypothetical protein
LKKEKKKEKKRKRFKNFFFFAAIDLKKIQKWESCCAIQQQPLLKRHFKRQLHRLFIGGTIQKPP